jgi:hypothetical protein
MNAALLIVAAACLASSEEPPLAAIPQAADVKRLPVGDPVSTPAAVPTPQPLPATRPAAMPTVSAESDPTRIVPMPAQSWDPAPPKRRGWLRSLFHHNTETYPQEIQTSSCACGANSQPVPAPTTSTSHKFFGWFHRGSQQNGDYAQGADGPVISSEGPASAPVVNGHP